jgi:hypothetical protein
MGVEGGQIGQVEGAVVENSHTVCFPHILGDWTRPRLTNGSVLWCWLGRQRRKTSRHTIETRDAVCSIYVHDYLGYSLLQSCAAVCSLNYKKTKLRLRLNKLPKVTESRRTKNEDSLFLSKSDVFFPILQWPQIRSDASGAAHVAFSCLTLLIPVKRVMVKTVERAA